MFFPRKVQNSSDSTDCKICSTCRITQMGSLTGETVLPISSTMTLSAHHKQFSLTYGDMDKTIRIMFPDRKTLMFFFTLTHSQKPLIKTNLMR